MVFSHHWIDISGEKSYGWGGWCGVVACRIIVSAPVPVPFLWTLDIEFRTWIWDLDLGLGFGTWIWDWTWALQFFILHKLVMLYGQPI